MKVIYNFLAIIGIISLVFLFVRIIKKKKLSEIGTMNIVLIVIGIAITLFVLKMIDLFETYMAVPDMLITCFFACCGGEAGILGWIKNTKMRNQDRQWQNEDYNRMKADEADIYRREVDNGTCGYDK